MLCDNCKNKPICIHTEYFNKYNYLSISSCEFYNLKQKTENVKLLELEKKFAKAKENFDNSLELQPYAPKQNTPKLELVKELTEDYPDFKGEPHVCENCNRNTYDEPIKCNKCGIETCNMCSNVDLDEFENRIVLCDTCYNKLHKDDIELEDNGLSLFDSLTQEIEIMDGDDNE